MEGRTIPASAKGWHTFRCTRNLIINGDHLHHTMMYKRARAKVGMMRKSFMPSSANERMHTTHWFCFQKRTW